MYTIVIKTMLENRDYPTAGKLLYREIQDNMEQQEQIVLDLDGVTLLPSMFLNVSVGQFIEDYGMEAMKRKLTFRNITRVQANRLKEYLERYDEPVLQA